ncbi:hypothetical protein A3C98_04880 [Candidatus Roizmanbacteria bacterium RIFCSPHIGHO2_02_FULL_37_15]|uniref:DUF5678 domain-containing protein n=1 Tax=Candidatus Roizmanbacteria bacterium RIFCSPLOWO2_01_FULL_37_16 TaxID=1802058 RepID=A0A1F7IQN1_9BACT|nr:MAG: hypothetical protein A2859_03375 [Candidatus Roizmanbacteria bacterium RIFCSPHIGHO2_01_FULL_37_16b]OGK22406.1 MAG: hypothetical protein A3C98_04880 [Candidatus Roizmanbacteria bacterium RIFCSPHIGHO2_02_FULL_37_15]OGK32128.1 MAG: hypothetical protein A3F57_03600 [Candidatus Roizmanbacteria bacterium RIFCSPHIGHO2_12_FULL_36_11]OGK45676.1 MAG: hypothetical protein A3B40_04315 [Candidatus Roizmanbacteria bacterium RIFCSPLOWO2_01_FULL_37_16]OGK57852.1 MAG: hypothetical protein A3I50_02285 [C
MVKAHVKKNLLLQVYDNPSYKGRHIIIIGGKVYATKTGKAKTQLLNKLLKKYPKETPTITYIPKVDSLILLS